MLLPVKGLITAQPEAAAATWDSGWHFRCVQHQLLEIRNATEHHCTHATHLTNTLLGLQGLLKPVL